MSDNLISTLRIRKHTQKLTCRNGPTSPFLPFPLFMAARQLAGRRPLYFTAGVSIILFFRRLISEVSGPIITKLCHMFGGDCNFLNLVRNLGVPPTKNLGAQKHQNFRFRALIANISGREQDIVDRKTALQTAITPLRVYQIW